MKEIDSKPHEHGEFMRIVPNKRWHAWGVVLIWVVTSTILMWPNVPALFASSLGVIAGAVLVGAYPKFFLTRD